MRVTLHVTTGPSTGQRIDLRGGHVAQFGRTEWADYSFGDDAQMADLHFALSCDDVGWRLKTLQMAQPTLVNGEAVTESRIHTGDIILAGKTSLKAEVEGEVTPLVRSASEETDKPMAESTDAPAAEAVALCTFLELEDEAHALAADSASDAELLERLIGDEQWLAAIRVQAHLLSKRAAVWWGLVCVGRVFDEHVLADAQRKALESARAWVKEPDDEHRRVAEKHAEAAEYEGPGGLLAAAAFWSEGSIAPIESPEPVPPDERLTGRTVANVLGIAALEKDPSQFEPRQQEFLQIGRDVADGKIELPSSAND